MTEAVTLVREPDGEEKLLYALTVSKYHKMLKDGILPEGQPFELLAGQVMRRGSHARGEDPMTVGEDHAVSVTKLVVLSPRLLRLGCHIRIQQPISLPPFNEPEPDGAIVMGTNPEVYRRHHPIAEQVPCVIEVSDATLQHDRVNKARVYAKSGIACYVIINLPDRVVEVSTDPLCEDAKYGQQRTLQPRQKVTLRLGKGKTIVIPVRELLP